MRLCQHLKDTVRYFRDVFDAGKIYFKATDPSSSYYTAMKHHSEVMRLVWQSPF